MALLRTLGVSLLLAASAGVFVRGDDAFDEQVENAIDRGTEFLLKAVKGEAVAPDGKPIGGWTAYQEAPMGSAAIQLYALVKSDIPFNFPVIKEGLQVLLAMPPGHTYSVSLYVMALDALLSQMDVELSLGSPIDQKERRAIEQRMDAMTQWLVRARWKGKGAWNYGIVDPASARYDNSNTQFAILALGVARKRGLKIPQEVWEEIAAQFIDIQQASGPEVQAKWKLKDAVDADAVDAPKPKRGKTDVRKPEAKPSWGVEDSKVFARGWSYMETKEGPLKHSVTFNMTCAGASSTLIAFDALKYVKNYPVDKRQALDKSIRDGLGCLTNLMNGRDSWQWTGLGGIYYALYSLEKVGDIGGIEAFGDFDWYRIGARTLLEQQNKQVGCWGDNDKPGNLNYMSALALLFLSRATDLTFHNRPMVRYGTGREVRQSDAQKSREWVFIPKMGVEVPVRRVLKKLRYLPTPKLMRMSEGIVENYDQQYLPELIPILAEVYEKTPYKPVKKYVTDSLVKITGSASEDMDAQRQFLPKWNEIVKAGTERDRNRIPRLRAILQEGSSPILIRKAIWALMRINDPDTFGDVLPFMSSDDLETRTAAYEAAKFIAHRRDLVFTPAAPKDKREQQLEAWRAHWEKTRPK